MSQKTIYSLAQAPDRWSEGNPVWLSWFMVWAQGSSLKRRQTTGTNPWYRPSWQGCFQARLSLQALWGNSWMREVRVREGFLQAEQAQEIEFQGFSRKWGGWAQVELQRSPGPQRWAARNQARQQGPRGLQGCWTEPQTMRWGGCGPRSPD